jgi:filamentous hemagglutinin family protein
MERNSSRLIRLIASVTAWVFFATSATANPLGGTVSQGQASITAAGNRVDIHQATDRALIDWRSFDIAPGEVTQFHQPSSSSLTVNRVNAATPSMIDGALQANGNIVLINPNGIAFGQGAAIDVNGLVASTSNIDDSTLNSGKLEFRNPGNPDARITNDGRITAKDAGLVGLVAPNVVNRGIIDARLGKVQLASGDTFTLDLYGDGLINLAVSGPVKEQLVSNSGLLRADGGTVSMTAAAGKNVVNGVINMDGIIQAQTIGEQNGKIVLFAEGSNAVKENAASDKGKKQGNSTVLVSGILDASGTDAITTRTISGIKGNKGQTVVKGERGGSIDVFGDQIAILNGAVFDVSGLTGQTNTTANGLLSDHRPTAAGGSIRIGGDYLGQGDAPAAKSLFVDTYTLFYADALHSGDAGRAIFWSDGDTDFRGNVYARGGLFGGNGGFVETSGKHHLDATGFVDLTAPKGNKGTYLLDPADITIYGNVDPAFVSTDGSIDLASSLKLWLDASDTTKVELTYSTDGLSGATATGTNGTNTITTSVDASANLAPGARIRLGAAGTVATANTVGADTYTIASIVGTTITLTGNLTQNYTTSTLHRGLVSELTDKSGQGNNASQATESGMPLWVSNGQNGRGIMNFDGGPDFIRNSSAFPTSSDYSLFIPVMQTAITGSFGNFLSGENPGRAIFFNNTDSPRLFHNAEFLSSTVSIPLNAYGIVSATFQNSTALGNIYVNSQSGGSGIAIAGVTDSTVYLGAYGGNFGLTGTIPEAIIYNILLSSNTRNLVEQYQSAKWGIALTPPGTGADEVTKATSADGYSVFTTRYLERLSQSADISLQATNSITLDLKGDTLALASDRNLSMTTATGNISSVSGGTLATNRTTTGGNITLTAGGTGAIDLSGLTLTATGGSISTLSGGATTLGSVNAGSILSRSTVATADLTIPIGKTITASNTSGDSIVLAAGRNFLNLAGSSALSTAGTARWLVYSTDPGSDTLGGLANDFRRFSCTYGGACPALGSGKGFLYSTTPTLTATPNVVNLTPGAPAPNLTGYGYTLAGYLGSDASADSVVGSLDGSTPYISGDPIGTYALNYASGILTSALGYAFTYSNNPAGIVVAALPNGGGGGGPPPAPIAPPPPVPPVSGSVTPPAPVTPPAAPPPVVASPLPSVIQMTLNQVTSQFGTAGMPGPQPNTLKTEINGNEIVLTPVASKSVGSGSANSESKDTDEESGEPVKTPCVSGSPYDPACYAGSGRTVPQ